MSAKTFIDTNILVYAHDQDEREKREIAVARIIHLVESRTLALSPQVLQEFYMAVTRKITQPLPQRLARQIIEDLGTWCTTTGPGEIATSFRIEDDSRINFWDALICASALKAGAQTILSEDLNSGQLIAGIRIENPFLT